MAVLFSDVAPVAQPYPGDRSAIGSPTNEAFAPSDHPVLAIARDEAVALGHPYIGAEHVLLGLLRAEDPEVDGVIATLGLDAEAIRAAMLRKVRPGASPGSAQPHHPYTTRTQAVIRLAQGFSERAELMGPTPMNFLEALVADGKNVAVAVLAEAVLERKGLQVDNNTNWRPTLAAEFQRAGLQWD